MNWISKQIGRIGTTCEKFMVTVWPISVTMRVTQDCDIYIIYIRGDAEMKSQAKSVKKSEDEDNLIQEIFFNNDVFSKKCDFYRENEEKYQFKEAELKITQVVNGKEEVLTQLPVDLASYIGKGIFREKIKGSGLVSLIEFDISIDPSSKEDPARSGSMVQPTVSQIGLGVDTSTDTSRSEVKTDSYEYKII